MDINKLKKRFKGEIFSDEETLREVSSDFGRLVHRTPAAIAVPKSSEDVQVALEMANENGWAVSVRGASHSQGGQSLADGGLCLDMLGLNRVINIEKESVWAESGILWGDIVDELLPLGLVPPVLTNNLNVTVGGTISVGGIGVSSHRYGIQAENVEALEVVTASVPVVRAG